MANTGIYIILCILLFFIGYLFRRNYCGKGITNAVSKGKIAITRNFAILLNVDGTLSLLGNNERFRQLHHPSGLSKVAASFAGYMALTNNGSVVTGGRAREFEKIWDIENLRNVKDIVASEGHTLALLENGQVKCIDENGGLEGVPQHSKIVKNWPLVKQIAVGYSNVIALTPIGTVLYHSEASSHSVRFYDKFSDIVQVDCFSAYYGNEYSAVLHANGTVSSSTFKGVKSWNNIIQIAVGDGVIIGLKNDGTIEMIGNYGQLCEAKKWQNIVSVECKYHNVVALTRNGEVLSIIQ